jgi:hypothetical protein
VRVAVPMMVGPVRVSVAIRPPKRCCKLSMLQAGRKPGK